MELIEVIWRHVLDRAASGRRHWPSLTCLAAELDIHPSTVHRSLAHPIEIGVIEQSRLGGVEVLDPARLLMCFGVHRRIARHITDTRTLHAPISVCEDTLKSQHVVLGGFASLIHHTGGENCTADYTTVIAYGQPNFDAITESPQHPRVTVLTIPADPWMPADAAYTTAAHAWADLFSLPGWQPARFINETDIHALTELDEPVLLV